MPGPASSPTYQQGCADGRADTARAKEGQPPLGPQPPYPDYPVMYLRGYRLTYDPSAGPDRNRVDEHDSAEPFHVDTEPISA